MPPSALARLLFAFVAVTPLSCCWLRNFQTGSRHAHCPSTSTPMDVRGVRYCLVTCPGVLEDAVHYRGLWLVGSFDGAQVLSEYQRDEHGYVAEAPTSVPGEVCRALPSGCTCVTEACHWFHRPALAPPHDPDVPLEFEQTARTYSPRCLATDPECGPNAFSGVCLDETDYHRGVPRKPISHWRAESEPCAYDGECTGGGCGYGCASVRGKAIHRVYDCVSNSTIESELSDAFCGCVDGDCEWFKQ